MVSSKKNRKVFGKCNCLPLCTSITYNAETHQAKEPDNPFRDKPSDVEIKFKDEELQVMERQELFSNADFVASCGSLLGLFTGFSVISLAEIIYFAAVRWVYDFWCFGKRWYRRNKQSTESNKAKE
ncbi:hypothetical protein Zmor_013480 [Zophobas morio]|uniref:Uncharacterized protein n=1 Tax=Zophobas morio TaxID=2755281 RepID=A0AA38IIM6_9CUCU|nr:hypothetical protein Zmor_013480 [Zophobas morio]